MAQIVFVVFLAALGLGVMFLPTPREPMLTIRIFIAVFLAALGYMFAFAGGLGGYVPLGTLLISAGLTPLLQMAFRSRQQ